MADEVYDVLMNMDFEATDADSELGRLQNKLRLLESQLSSAKAEYTRMKQATDTTTEALTKQAKVVDNLQKQYNTANKALKRLETSTKTGGKEVSKLSKIFGIFSGFVSYAVTRIEGFTVRLSAYRANPFIIAIVAIVAAIQVLTKAMNDGVSVFEDAFNRITDGFRVVTKEIASLIAGKQSLREFFELDLLGTINQLQELRKLLKQFNNELGIFEANAKVLILVNQEKSIRVFNQVIKELTRDIELLNKQGKPVKKTLEDLIQPGLQQEIIVKIGAQIVAIENLIKAEEEKAKVQQTVLDKEQEIINATALRLEMLGADSVETGKNQKAQAELILKQTELNEKLKATTQEYRNQITALKDLAEEKREDLELTLKLSKVPDPLGQFGRTNFNEVVGSFKDVIRSIEEIEDRLEQMDANAETAFNKSVLFWLNRGRSLERAGLRASISLQKNLIPNLEEVNDLLQEQGRTLQARAREYEAVFRGQLARVGVDIKNLTQEIVDASSTGFNDIQRLAATQYLKAVEQIKDLLALLDEVDAQIIASKLELTVSNKIKIENLFNDIADQARAVGNILNSVGSLLQADADRNIQRIDKQIDLIERLKDAVLESNADIIASEENKLERLIQKRREHAVALREVARIEFLANSISAIAQAAATPGGFGWLQIIPLIATLLSGIAKLKSAAIFHKGTESVDFKNKKEGFALVAQNERILSAQQNAMLKGMSNKDLVRYAQIGALYASLKPQTSSLSDKHLSNHTKLLENIHESLSSLQMNVGLDQRGFYASMTHFNNWNKKVNLIRR